MRSLRRHVARVLLLSLAVSAVSVPPAAAGVPSDQLRAHIDRVLKVLEDPELKKDARVRERRAAVRRIANDIFDFGETARRSLGRHWQGRTPAEREQFVQLFSDLLERSYISRVELYGGEKIQYLGDAVDGEQARVLTRLLTKNGGDIPIEYRMHRRDGDRWLAYDVVIEGVSLVANYRTQFNKIIQTSSYQELVKKMKTKQEELVSGPSS
jgi:phospholipid transport system substrate-binding protein